MTVFKLGEPLDEKNERFVKMAPPVVFSTQATGFVPLESPEDLRAWEVAMRQTTGMEIDADRIDARACETGCGPDCCSDMCDMA